MLYNYPWGYVPLINLPTSVMGNVMTPVAFAACGCSDKSKMRDAYIYMLRVALAFFTTLGVLIFIISDPLISLPTCEEGGRVQQLKPEFVWVFRMSAFLVPFSAIMELGSATIQSIKRSDRSMALYLSWGILKLCVCAAICMVSFKAIICAMIALHVFSGFLMTGMAWRMFSRLDPNAGSE